MVTSPRPLTSNEVASTVRVIVLAPGSKAIAVGAVAAPPTWAIVKSPATMLASTVPSGNVRVMVLPAVIAVVGVKVQTVVEAGT
ncbi:hypothetical protein ES703_76600 [subsurface metagenome]